MLTKKEMNWVYNTIAKNKDIKEFHSEEKINGVLYSMNVVRFPVLKDMFEFALRKTSADKTYYIRGIVCVEFKAMFIQKSF